MAVAHATTSPIHSIRGSAAAMQPRVEDNAVKRSLYLVQREELRERRQHSTFHNETTQGAACIYHSSDRTSSCSNQRYRSVSSPPVTMGFTRFQGQGVCSGHDCASLSRETCSLAHLLRENGATSEMLSHGVAWRWMIQCSPPVPRSLQPHCELTV